MSRMDQVNEVLRQELAIIISSEPPVPNTLVTIKHVKCSPDLKNATIFISVLPDKFSGSTLSKLRKSGKFLSKNLRNRVHLKYMPRFNWRLDTNERYADEIEDALKNID